jgi:hypothetical protein
VLLREIGYGNETEKDGEVVKLFPLKLFGGTVG